MSEYQTELIRTGICPLCNTNNQIIKGGDYTAYPRIAPVERYPRWTSVRTYIKCETCGYQYRFRGYDGLQIINGILIISIIVTILAGLASIGYLLKSFLSLILYLTIIATELLILTALNAYFFAFRQKIINFNVINSTQFLIDSHISNSDEYELFVDDLDKITKIYNSYKIRE
jgi:uncharacterized protein (DUF983 family)